MPLLTFWTQEALFKVISLVYLVQLSSAECAALLISCFGVGFFFFSFCSGCHFLMSLKRSNLASFAGVLLQQRQPAALTFLGQEQVER